MMYIYSNKIYPTPPQVPQGSSGVFLNCTFHGCSEYGIDVSQGTSFINCFFTSEHILTRSISQVRFE